MDTCTRGHEKTPENGYEYGRTWICRVCRTEYQRSYRERAKDDPERLGKLRARRAAAARRHRLKARQLAYEPWGNRCVACNLEQPPQQLRFVTLSPSWRNPEKMLVCDGCRETHQGSWPKELLAHMQERKNRLNLPDED